jgi:plastocyanin
MRFILITVVIAGAMVAVVSSGTPRTTAVDASVEVGDLYFCAPSFQDSVCETSITAGDAVTWVLVGNFHTVTQCTSGFAQCPDSGGFDSGVLNQGQTFQQNFPNPGTIEYLCLVHPQNMRGRIVVSAPTPVPTPSPSLSGAVSPTITPVAQNGDQTDSPAAVPAGGGAPTADHSDPLAWIAFFVGGAMFVAAGATATATARRHRD